MIIQWFTIGCLIITLGASVVSVYFLRRAARLNSISEKLRTGDRLTAKEQQLLDRIAP